MTRTTSEIITQPFTAVRTALPKTAHRVLKSFLRRSLSIVPDLDPVMQVMAALLAFKIATTGLTFDRETAITFGMLAMMVVEELI